MICLFEVPTNLRILFCANFPRKVVSAVSMRSLLATAACAASWLSATPPSPCLRSGHVYAQLGDDSGALATLGGALARIELDDEAQQRWTLVDGPAWMLVPPAMPWASVHFVGGAGFGTAPQICYDALLTALVQRCGVAVIATPYEVSTNHWGLSESVHAAFETALEECRARTGLAESAPVFRLGHSLGGKLLCCQAVGGRSGSDGASNGDAQNPVDAVAASSIGLLAFNNFGLADSAALVSEVLNRVRGGDERADATARAVLDAFNVVQQVASVAGVKSLEFQPTPLELDEAMKTRYAVPSTKVFRFNGDKLDSSDALMTALPPSAKCDMTALVGSHLSPVVFRLTGEDIDPALALLLGTNRGFTFGDTKAIEPLCDALSEWIWPSGMASGPPALAAATGDVEPEYTQNSE
jgi:hypothetical protein